MQYDFFSGASTKTTDRIVSLFDLMTEALAGSNGKYVSKDLLKAKSANKFIGRGSLASSTHKYMLAAGDLANCGTYETGDVVFISAEGDRSGRISFDANELMLAIRSNVTFITDVVCDRNRAYNVGEREVAEFLRSNGYSEIFPGKWTSSN